MNSTVCVDNSSKNFRRLFCCRKRPSRNCSRSWKMRRLSSTWRL